MAVDQTGTERDAMGVDHRRRAGGVAVLLLAERGNLAVLGDQRVGVKDRVLQRARQHQADILDDQLLGHETPPYELEFVFAGRIAERLSRFKPSRRS